MILILGDEDSISRCPKVSKTEKCIADLFKVDFTAVNWYFSISNLLISVGPFPW